MVNVVYSKVLFSGIPALGSVVVSRDSMLFFFCLSSGGRGAFSPPFPFRSRRLFRSRSDKIPLPCTTMSPTTPVFDAPSDDALAALSESSRACIERLCKHEPPEHFELGTSEYVWRSGGPTRRTPHANLILLSGMCSRTRRYWFCCMNALALLAGYACS